jgi:hypothetical protein
MSYVYFIECQTEDKFVKIGRTSSMREKVWNRKHVGFCETLNQVTGAHPKFSCDHMTLPRFATCPPSATCLMTQPDVLDVQEQWGIPHKELK